MSIKTHHAEKDFMIRIGRRGTNRTKARMIYEKAHYGAIYGPSPREVEEAEAEAWRREYKRLGSLT